MKTTTAKCFFVVLFIFFLYSNPIFAALTFDWNGSRTSCTSSISFINADAPGSPNVRATNILKFGVTYSFINQTFLITSLTSCLHTARYATASSKPIIYKVSDFQTGYGITDATKVNYNCLATQSSGTAIILLLTIQS
jgi:hypothetical protein